MSTKIKIVSFFKKNAPFVIEFGRKIKKYFKKRELAQKKKNNEVVTKERLKNDLLKLGIKKGDSVMVHISLSKVGYVEGGAEAIVDVLLDAVGDEGNLLMPAFAHHTFSKYYLDNNPVFDILNSTSMAGAVTEVFRKRAGTLRSFHPTDSVCAKGLLAVYFTNSHFDQLTPYNANSPYFKFALKKGKILNIGVPLNTSCTNLHTLEDAVEFKFPIYHPHVYEVKMKDEQGMIKTMKTKVHDPLFSQKRQPDELIPMFEKDGVLVHGNFGEANVMLVDAAGLFDSMIKNYKEKGITMYTPFGH